MAQAPKKLLDSDRHGPGTELFIVEGDSAARAVGAIRAPDFQAVLPMQGKPLNAAKASRHEVLEHPKYADVLRALGIEPDPINPDGQSQNDDGFHVDPESLQFERVILLFDPDADGIHARTLMHLFFYRWLRPMLDAECILDAYPPLWQLTSDEIERPMYAFTKPHYDRIRSVLSDRQIEPTATRYRGLANIPEKVLASLCLDPETRQASTVRSADVERAMRVFESMRGQVRSATDT